MKRKLSPWCKEVKKTLIDRDMSVTELCGEVGKSATEINKMSRETMDEVLKSLDFEKIRGWYDGEEVKSE